MTCQAALGNEIHVTGNVAGTVAAAALHSNPGLLEGALIDIDGEVSGWVNVTYGALGDIDIGGDLTSTGEINIAGDVAGDVKVGTSSGDIDGDVNIGGEMTGNICADNLDPEDELPENIDIGSFGPYWTICDELGCICDGPSCTSEYDCQPNDVLDTCDIMDRTSQDCNVTSTPDECEEGYPFDAQLISAVPATEESLWRSEKNVMRLTFACDIDAPSAGDVEIREMEDEGDFGDDLSSNFSFTVENDRILRIYETTSVLDHRTWYAIRHTDSSWDDVACFQLQYVVQVGDADQSESVSDDDLSVINANMGPTGGADDSRFDIDGNFDVTSGDLSICNAHNPSGTVSKPSGHDDDPCD